jgi:serine/threonine protein phosphatase PrpC
VIANDKLHKAYNLAFLATNNELHKNETDDCMSGTSTMTVLVIRDTLYVANVCDLRVVLTVKYENKIVTGDLSSD